ncbi:MAG: flagellar basal body protein [Rhodospirillales bacterium]|nr:flagellar basal body protein [Rhodospirillales bacterium]
MALSQALGSVTSALQANASRVAVAAENIVNVHTEGYKAKGFVQETIVTKNANGDFTAGGVRGLVRTPPNPQEVDLASEFIGLTVAESAYKGASLVARTVDEMADTLVDIKA